MPDERQIDTKAKEIMGLLGDADDAAEDAQQEQSAAPYEGDETESPEAQADGGDTETEDEPGKKDSKESPSEPAIDPPVSWKAEEKERFKTLPRATQKYLAERERERDTFVSRTQQEAAEHRKAVDAERSARLQDRQAHAQQLGTVITMNVMSNPAVKEVLALSGTSTTFWSVRAGTSSCRRTATGISRPRPARAPSCADCRRRRPRSITRRRSRIPAVMQRCGTGRKRRATRSARA
jgi:hypothetical protein